MEIGTRERERLKDEEVTTAATETGNSAVTNTHSKTHIHSDVTPMHRKPNT